MADKAVEREARRAARQSEDAPPPDDRAAARWLVCDVVVDGDEATVRRCVEASGGKITQRGYERVMAAFACLADAKRGERAIRRALDYAYVAILTAQQAKNELQHVYWQGGYEPPFPEAEGAARTDSYVPTYRDFARGLAIVAHVKKLGWNVFKAHFPKPEWVALSYTESTGLLRQVSFQLGSNTPGDANELGGFGPIARQSSKENMRAVATQYFSHLRQTFPQFFDDPVINDYTTDTPSPEAAASQQLPMGEKEAIDTLAHLHGEGVRKVIRDYVAAKNETAAPVPVASSAEAPQDSAPAPVGPGRENRWAASAPPGNFPTVLPTTSEPPTEPRPIPRRAVARTVTAEELTKVPPGLQVKQHKKYDFVPEDLADPDKVKFEQSISNARKRKIRVGEPLSKEEDERGRMAEAFVKRAGRHALGLKPNF